MAIDRQLTSLLRDCVRTVGTEFSLYDALYHLVETAVDIMPVTGAGVTLISAGVAPRPFVASDGLAMEFETLQSSLGEGPCVAAWETGDLVAIPDLGVEQRFPSFAPCAFEAGLKAVFTFPLGGIKGRVGALDLYRDRPGSLSEDWMAAAETVAEMASAYLLGAREHVHLYEPPVSTAALHHELAGLPNRTLLLDRLEQARLRSGRTRKASAVFVVDLYPSEVAGPAQQWQVDDELLVEVAQRLSRMSRPGDTVAYLADDQFVIVCEGLHKPADADAFAARVESGMECPFFISGVEVQITALVSVAFADGQCSATELLARHTARGEPGTKLGRDDLNRYGILRGQHCVDRADLDRDLQGAAGRGELFIHYQPIVGASDGEIIAVEALLRWLHPTVGLVEPTAFIPVAEHSGLMVEIGQWVLEQALQAARSWQSLGQDGGSGVAVNVSAHQLRSAGFVDAVKNVLHASRTDPSRLTLEVTESASVSDAAIDILSDLKDLGVKLALDDFGTGYSSLVDIARFPVDIIKVDRTFVAGMGEDVASSKIVGSVIELAHALGMIVVAEGVETEGQLLELAKLSCDAYQGFYFSPAMSATKLEALCQSAGPSSFRSMLSFSRSES